METTLIRRLVAATITYNVIEAVVAVWSGAAADSTALIAFGLDSVIEVSSAAAVAWQFSATDPALRERRALRMIAWSFFALAAYVAVSSGHALLAGSSASPSIAGIILASVSLVVMPVLSFAQRRAGRALDSVTAVADSRQTLLCTALSGVLLAGLALNALLGWSWADPVAGLVVAGAALREGRNAWRGDACCAPTVPRNHAAEPVLLQVGAGELLQPRSRSDDECCDRRQPQPRPRELRA
jgi:divalent metal cation (Fe/Co/Zn/Cd) transporter